MMCFLFKSWDLRSSKLTDYWEINQKILTDIWEIIGFLFDTGDLRSSKFRNGKSLNIIDEKLSKAGSAASKNLVVKIALWQRFYRGGQVIF